jgi:cytochrome b
MRIEHLVWDPMVRLFHWINVAAFAVLVVLGLIISFGGALELPAAGRAAVIQLHVAVGYVFAANLGVRLVWAWIGGRHARWSAVLPFGRDYPRHLRDYLHALRQGQARHYLGHNPLGRLMVTALLTMLAVQALSGLLLAGTDLYRPPFGSVIAAAVAAPGVDPALLVPGDRSSVDPAAYRVMRNWRAPVGEGHEILLYLLLLLVALHVAGVVVGEITERGGLVSAMIHGRKSLGGPPVDGPP